ncbi:MAG: MerR family transcriptional regulator [Actinomycetota bacterium]
MPLSRTRDYLSIGEVLDEVRSDFPDVSISKIRFLEAEGLLTPERTASGYRKFFPDDVARLRYILALQRDQFLPLKVIRERLAGADAAGAYPDAGPAASSAATNGGARPPSPVVGSDLTAAQLTRRELVAAAGLTDAQLADLEEFGILARRDGDLYDENDLAACSAAAGMLEFGLQARHLRMFRQFADRETGTYEQLVAPGALRKNREEARARTAQSLAQLVAHARRLHDALVRSNLRALL